MQEADVRQKEKVGFKFRWLVAIVLGVIILLDYFDLLVKGWFAPAVAGLLIVYGVVGLMRSSK